MTTPGLPVYRDDLLPLIDDPLRAAREIASAGTRVIGYLGNQTPVALILAAGAMPVRLHGGAGLATMRADEFLESAHMPALRAVCEQWLAGSLDFLHAVVFPRTDDSAQRLYYYVCELQRRGLCGGPRPLLHDVANIARPASLAHSRDSTQRLARELGIDETRVASSVARVARRERLLAQLRQRQQDDTPIPGSLAWRLTRASSCDWREEFDGALERGIVGAPASSSARRVLLAGDAPPDETIHRAVETAGGSIVLELTEWESGDYSARSGTVDAIADDLHARRNPVLAMRDAADWVAKRARDVRADAVLFWLLEEDEALPWEIARQQRSLQSAGIPALLLARQRWQPDGTLIESVTSFVAGLEGAR